MIRMMKRGTSIVKVVSTSLVMTVLSTTPLYAEFKVNLEHAEFLHSFVTSF